MPSSDPSTPLGPATPLVMAAIALGGRANDAGDPAGAHDLYACAARLVRRVRGVSEVADFRLEQAIEEAESRADDAESAHVLYDAFESLLPDDELPAIPDEPLRAVQHFIELAISIGAPAYNLDDHQGCYDVYSCTARMILATLSGADTARARLQAALDECRAEPDEPTRQAWAMRHGFDAVLDMAGTGGTGVAPNEIRQLLAMAITIGAPAFDLGDTRGCYDVYACTARLIIHSVSVEDGIKDHLRAALSTAALIPAVARQAWVLRHAFDAILEGTTQADDSDEVDDDDLGQL